MNWKRNFEKISHISSANLDKYSSKFHPSSQATPEESRDHLELLPLPAVDKAREGDAVQAEQREGDATTGTSGHLSSANFYCTTVQSIT